MSMTLYFAKLNLVSDDIFELYDDPKQRKAIAYALYEAIKANKTWKKENFFIDAAGEQRSTVIEYSTHILRVDDTYSHIEGWLYKKSKLYYKTLDIAGIAIVIALFTADQIKLIDDLKEGSFDQLLYDFKWFALVSAVEAVIFIATIFVIKSPYPIAPIWLFYILTFCLIYGVLYLLFYGCALIGNFIKMAKIKCVLDSALKAKKDISVVAIEVQLNFLVSKLLGGDKQASREFYNELIEIIEKSSMNNKDELIAYLKERYTAF